MRVPVFACERRASRLNGPAPSWEISNAPPGMETFFMNMIICIWAIIGSMEGALRFEHCSSAYGMAGKSQLGRLDWL